MAQLAGIKPTTSWFVAKCSIQLNYSSAAYQKITSFLAFFDRRTQDSAGVALDSFSFSYTPPAPAFTFSEFLSPIDNMSALNTVKAGSAIPVKFSLGDDKPSGNEFAVWSQ